MTYNSFSEAYAALNIPFNPEVIIDGDNVCGIASLKLIDGSESYNEILQNGRIIKFVGFGRLFKSGHPASNQQWLTQEPFRISMENSIVIPVLRKTSTGLVIFLGNYQIKDIIKKMGYEGFSFFHIILQRIDKHPEVNMEIYKTYKYIISATNPAPVALTDKTK
jgi:hypothetical protein